MNCFLKSRSEALWGSDPAGVKIFHGMKNLLVVAQFIARSWIFRVSTKNISGRLPE